mgnify:CR=1 FL=1
MNQHSNPKIRFREIVNKWNNYKLGQLGNFKSGIGFPDSQQGGTEGIPFFKVSDMNNIGNETEMRNANNYVTQEQIMKNSWKVINETPAIIFAKVGAALMLNRKRLVTRPFLIDNNTMSYSFDESWDKDFGLTLFQTINLPKYAQIGALPSYNASDIAMIKVNVPNIQEQSAIGSLFRTLDDLLASYKDNLSNYQSLKATMLSKMFPKAGQTVPEIRLDGFEDEWGKYYLGDIFEQVSNYIEPSVENELWSLTVEKGLTPKTDRYKRDFLVKKNDKFKKVDVNEFVYNPMNLTLGALDLNDNEVTISVSGYYVVMKNRDIEKFDNDFLKILLKTTYAIYQYKQFATGTLIEKQRVQFPTFSEIPFYLPPIAEQQALGAYFSNLDNLIAAHQEKISRLETLKKKLLQDMFI